MDRFLSIIRRYYAILDRAQTRLSEKWRAHTNRRTIVILVVFGALALVAYLGIIRPPNAFPVGELVTIPQGATSREIANVLYEDGVVRSPLSFRIISAILGDERTLHAGDYLFKEPRDIFSVERTVSRGAFGLEPERIRIPEGATARSMSAIYASRLLRFNAANFLAQAQPQEGYLFPDTYFFLPNATEDQVIQAMRQNFDTHEATIDAEVQASGHSLNEIVTMASILEREARTPQDRRMISGVLWNRIRKGMALQVDATFLYMVGKSTFQLTVKDLTTDSPYNTYTNKGLPPGPIGSPSMDSLEAAANPIKNDYLFYLADRHGITHYSKTYQEHLQKKRLYLGT